MPNKLVLEGVEAFRDALRNLPSDLAQDAQGIVTGAAESAKSEIVAAYPEVTGNLKRGVTVKTEQSPFGVVATVKSNAHHVHLYEFGSQVRHTDIGASRGAMPARPVFIPVVTRRRRAMNDALKGLLVRAGFQVTGDAG